MGNIKGVLKDELRKNLLEYYNTTIPKEDAARSAKYVGTNVVWYGNKGNMVVLHKSQVHGMWGNIYNHEKMNYLSDLIQNHDEKVELECSYGIPSIVTLIDILEHQNSYLRDDFGMEYEGYTKPYSTGDSELDEYLGIEYPTEHDMLGCDEEDIMNEFIELYRTELAQGRYTPEHIKNEFYKVLPEPSEFDLECLSNYFKLEAGLKNVIDNELGDYNKLSVQLRDGHHRVFGAIQSGEEYVCVNIPKDNIDGHEDYLNFV
jgi:hypothetical protein